MEKTISICGFITTPRYVCNWPRNIINSAFNRLGIPLVNTGGVFYGQCMQRMFEDAIAKGINIGVTVDSDSVFRPDQLERLIQVAVNHDEIDALAALQPRRGAPFPLLGLDGAKLGDTVQIEFEGKPLKVDTAHFGLTVIKLDKLKDVPKPWFWAKPSEDGEWGENRIDDDIWFWRQWSKAGLTVHVDSSVSIGHMEEVVSVFDDCGKHKMKYTNDWYTEQILEYGQVKS